MADDEELAALAAAHGHGDGAVSHAQVVVEGWVVGRGDEDGVSGFGDAHEEVVEDGAAPGGDAQLVGADLNPVVALGEDPVHVRLWVWGAPGARRASANERWLDGSFGAKKPGWFSCCF